MTFRVTSQWAWPAVLLILAASANAGILGQHSLEIDFTKPAEARQKATWSEPDRLMCTARGFGLDAEDNACRDGWLQTTPVGVGESWRPTGSTRLSVTLKPARRMVTLPNGQTYTPSGPSVYARHSPDAVHWSDWQPLARDMDASAKSGTLIYRGELGVPHRNREAYDKLHEEYRKLDVPWVDDEEALCAWIVKREPEFFSRNRPFVGYVQYLIEDCFPGGQRIESLSASMSWAISGMHHPPKDPNAEKRHSTVNGWRFRGEAAASKEGSGVMDFEFFRKVSASDQKIELVPAAKVKRTKQGLMLSLKITNASPIDLQTTLTHEWHGGEWPPTALYASIQGPGDAEPRGFAPVYLIGEDPNAPRSVTLADGKGKDVELRMDWPGTGSVRGRPLIQEAGEYAVRFALVFEIAGKKQYVVTPTQIVVLPAE